MSFYGSVVNYLTKSFKRIIVGKKTFVANDYEAEVDLTESLDTLYGISITTIDDPASENLKYQIVQGESTFDIDIPRSGGGGIAPGQDIIYDGGTP